MQRAPAGWNAMFTAPHKTEYKFVIDGVDYTGENIIGNPVITKPLLDEPTIGRVCSTTVSVVIIPIDGVTIPKAARVAMYVRLVSPDGSVTTGWLAQGKYYISSRTGKTNITLTLRDDMIKAGQTYFDKSSIIDWPASQVNVAADIASIMGVELDARSNIRGGSSYRVNSMGTDILISEVLSGIAASNIGNWIITETGKLRLVTLGSPSAALPSQALGTNHSGYTDMGVDVHISRVTMTDDNDNTYTAGNDTGYEIAVYNPFADEDVVSSAALQLERTIYRPHRIDRARLNPLLELGDTISVQKSDGDTVSVLFESGVITCNVGYTATVEAKPAQDAEEEFPYQTPAQLKAARAVRTDKTYYGASLNKGSGLIVRRIQGEEEQARVTFNSDEMAFYQGDTQVLYFDAVNRKWQMSAEMNVQVANGDGSTTELNVLAQGLTAEVSDVNGRTLTIEATVDGLTITDEHGNTLIDGGSIYTDDLYLSRLFSRTGSMDSYIEMLENGLNFILGRTESIGIGYSSASVPLPYLVFGAGCSPNSDDVGMVKKYANGIWIGDSADRNTDAITRGTGFFVDTGSKKLYKYVNGFGAELADTSNVIAVFG